MSDSLLLLEQVYLEETAASQHVEPHYQQMVWPGAVRAALAISAISGLSQGLVPVGPIVKEET